MQLYKGLVVVGVAVTLAISQFSYEKISRGKRKLLLLIKKKCEATPPTYVRVGSHNFIVYN